jgi:hypothetical protein
MHISLDSALGQQRRLNQVGESITQIAPDPAAAYSLRSLTGSDPKVVRVRRGSDNDERDFTASEVSSGALTSYVNAQVVAPLDIKALSATGRDGAYQIAKAAYSLRSLGTRQATVAATGDTVARADGKFVAQVRRNVNGDLKSFTADEVTDGTLTSFVNESFTSSLPLDVAGSAAAAYGLRNLSSSYTGNVVEVRRASTPQFSASSRRNFTAAEVADGTLVNFVTEPIPKTLSVFPAGSDSTWDVTVVDNSNYTIDCNNNTSTKFCRLINSNLPAGTKYRAEFTLTTNSGDASNLKLNRSSPFNLQNITEGSNSIEFDFTTATFLQFRVGAGSNVFNATISNLTVTAIGNDGHVSTWYDQSGNGNNATQATPASQPKIVSSGSLLNELDFDGTSHRLDIDFGSNLSQPNSIFMVHQSGTTLGEKNDFFDELGTTGQRTLLDQTGSNYRIFAGSSATSSLSSDTNKNLITAIYNGASSILAKNGTAESALNPSTQSISSTSAIGFSENATQYYQGTMQEFIIYNSDQSDKRRAIEESIATANGITLSSFNRDGFVKTWYDQSVSDQSDAGSTPTGNHATQATADNQPKIVNAGALNADGLLFDGTNDALFATSAISSTNIAIAVVAKSATTSSGTLFSNLDAFNDGHEIFSNGPNNMRYALEDSDLDVITNITNKNLYFANYDGSTQSLAVNGTNNTQSATKTVDTITSVAQIGSRQNSNFQNGSIEEIIVYTSDQTANRTAIEANIGETYSIDLPSGVDPGFDQVDGFVETWYDQSGNGRDVTQATAGSQPKIVDAGALVVDGEGNPSLFFDASDDFLSVYLGDSTSVFSSFVAASFLSDTSNSGRIVSWTSGENSFIDNISGNIIPHIRNSTNQSVASYASGFFGTSSITYGNLFLHSCIFNTGTASNFMNGLSSGSKSVTYSLTDRRILLGRGEDRYLKGNISCYVLYDADQSANRTAIETNIAAKYGITLS